MYHIYVCFHLNQEDVYIDTETIYPLQQSSQNLGYNWGAQNVLSRHWLTPAANQCRKVGHGGDGDGHNGEYDEQVFYIEFFLGPSLLYLGLTDNPRLADTCFRKCVNSDYKETELNKGESVCLDRCVNKFVEVFQKVDFSVPTFWSLSSVQKNFIERNR